MPRGGKREGAGRKKEYTFSEILSFAKEVTWIQREQSVSRNKAIQVLYDQGKAPPHYKEMKRYLTPKFFQKHLADILLNNEHNGLISLIKPMKTKE
jgi:hypothetical protein